MTNVDVWRHIASLAVSIHQTVTVEWLIVSPPWLQSTKRIFSLSQTPPSAYPYLHPRAACHFLPGQMITWWLKQMNEHKGLLSRQVHLQETAVVVAERRKPIAWMRTSFFNRVQECKIAALLLYKWTCERVLGLQCVGSFRIRAEASRDPNRATQIKQVHAKE